jgi:hypothetical protein
VQRKNSIKRSNNPKKGGMMITTKYICDRCGKEQDTIQQIWSVNINVFANPGVLGGSYPTKNVHQDWCRECTELFGLLPVVEIKKEEVKQNVTLEDIIREIAREEIENK